MDRKGWFRKWPQIRALLIIGHLLAITLMALPSPSRDSLRPSSWNDPTVQGELTAWRERVSETIDEEALRGVASTVENVRRIILWPFEPYYRYGGAWQSWGMFVAPHRHPSRLHIEIAHASGDWQPIYIAGDSTHRWRRRLFEHDRMRAALFRYAWPIYRPSFRKFGEWVAKEVAAEFPDADRLRLHYFQYRTRSPQEVGAGAPIEGSFSPSLTYLLKEHR